MLIIYVPHTCIDNKIWFIIDPGCDYMTKEYAGFAEEYMEHNNIDTKVIYSEIRRKECDNNRGRCRYTKSRNALRKYITRDNFILEIHSFDKRFGTWRGGVYPDPDVVILSMPSSSYVDYTIASFIEEQGYDVEILQGSEINDVQKEVNEMNGNGLLLELSQSLKRKDIFLIAKAITEALKI